LRHLIYKDYKINLYIYKSLIILMFNSVTIEYWLIVPDISPEIRAFPVFSDKIEIMQQNA